MDMTPKEIIAYLDNYVIGQQEAKKSIALALRTRYRRMRLDETLRDEVTPKNILMIGSTGVGKTEIARRLAKMMHVPFIKVEASKYTEVGFVGRDVESMIRDLLMNAINIVKSEHQEKNIDAIYNYVLNKIVDKLLPPLPNLSTSTKKEEYERSRERMKERVISGELDDKLIEIELSEQHNDLTSSTLPPEMENIQESMSKLFGAINKRSLKKEVSVLDAQDILKQEASDKLLNMEAVKKEAIKRTQEGGIIFLDEIDKIAVGAKNDGRSDPSKEGVQRDLLPIVEGSSVNTKFGPINTEHILFIAAGAFHVSKPSDLIPELQGRFPLRVELNSLSEDILYKILTEPKNSLIKQYQALLKVEEVELVFEDEAIVAMAKLSQEANEKSEDIGARRLHTIIERVVEDISFDAQSYRGKSYTITKAFVHEKLDHVIEDDDLSRYIL